MTTRNFNAEEKAKLKQLISESSTVMTEVETLTSGPGMVFTIKDINEILIDFCNTTIKDGEK